MCEWVVRCLKERERKKHVIVRQAKGTTLDCRVWIADEQRKRRKEWERKEREISQPGGHQVYMILFLAAVKKKKKK